ncbi:hypothetical protein H4R26_004380 [Coemansia thaxteri]|uniref:RING-type domain-containing protein n=1 Tax=Coemansia thaxteri TaxID=2663907 RepID=A0A9W8BHE6_9FUNG|nr:hypothetical protein H4R26_004380 [Coemansia thaxteri]
MAMATKLLLLGVAVLLLLGPALGAPRELVVSYRTCTEGEGCHVVDQVSFHGSHMRMLPLSRFQNHLQGRVVDMGNGCPRTESPAYAHDGSGHHRGNGSRRRTVGLVRCGTCPLTDMLHEAVRRGVSGVVVVNTKMCGRPTNEFLELAGNLGIPVAFVSEKVTKEILAMRQQVLELRRQREGRTDGLGHFAFVYVSAVDDSQPHFRRVFVRILASAHILLAAAVLLAMAVYFSLACSVGSLRYVPREIAPGIFGPRPEPLDPAIIDRLPLVPVEWDVLLSAGCSDDEARGSSCCPGSEDEESRQESPGLALGPALGPEKQDLLNQLAIIIQNSGAGSYSFTDERMCAICLCRYLPHESLRLLPCKHAFHRKCIDTWLLSKDMTVHCPVCKSSIVDGLRQLEKHGYSRVLDQLHRDPVAEDAHGNELIKPAAALPLYHYRRVSNGVSRAAAAIFNATFGRWRRRRQ